MAASSPLNPLANPSADQVRVFGPILQALHKELSCIARAMERIEKNTASSAYEFGQYNPAITPPDVTKLPFVQVLSAVQPTTPGEQGQSVRANLRSGKRSAIRGFIENTGEAKAKVWLELNPEKGEGTDRRAFYLLPGRVYDITHALDGVVVETTGDGDVEVQVIAQ